MIWDNCSIFRTNCVILTSYIRADPRTGRCLWRGCCHVAWSKWWVWRGSLADFSQRWQGIRQGIRSRAPTCSCLPWAKGKGEFCPSWKQFCAANEKRFCTAAMLHGRNKWKYFAYERTSFPMAKGIFCSCHATWLPCKTPIWSARSVKLSA